MHHTQTIIIGGGLAGINCARYLEKAGVDYRLIEATDSLGGRMKTDEYKGFLLDRGFQVFLSAYPEAMQTLDYDRLDLQSFMPGSIIRINNSFQKVIDPANQPLQALGSIFAPLGSLADKFKLASLRSQIMSKSPESIFSEKQGLTTYQYLKQKGFSDKIIDRLFRPFLGGIYLSRDLETSSQMLEFVFRMFSEGDTCVPAKGIQAIPRQLAESIPDEKVILNQAVTRMSNQAVTLSNGETLTADSMVVATEAPQTAELLELDNIKTEQNSTTCLYFSVQGAPPTKERLLILNGNPDGPINSIAVMSQVAPSYAPKGKHLVAVSIVGPPPQNPEEQALAQLKTWYDPAYIDQWEHLRTYTISYGLPAKTPDNFLNDVNQLELPPYQFVCGDHLTTPSQNGAMVSGREAAQRVLAYLSEPQLT